MNVGAGPFDRDEASGPNRPLKDLAWGLASRGVAVLRFDKITYARPDLVAEDRHLKGLHLRARLEAAAAVLAHCLALIEQTKKNRKLPRIACNKCGREFGTQWSSTEADKADLFQRLGQEKSSNIHAADVVKAFDAFHSSSPPQSGLDGSRLGWSCRGCCAAGRWRPG